MTDWSALWSRLRRRRVRCSGAENRFLLRPTLPVPSAHQGSDTNQLFTHLVTSPLESILRDAFAAVGNTLHRNKVYCSRPCAIHGTTAKAMVDRGARARQYRLEREKSSLCVMPRNGREIGVKTSADVAKSHRPPHFLHGHCREGIPTSSCRRCLCLQCRI